MTYDVFGQVFSLAVGGAITLHCLYLSKKDRDLRIHLQNELPLIKEGRAILDAEPSSAKRLGEKYRSMIGPTLERIEPYLDNSKAIDPDLSQLVLDYYGTARGLSKALDPD
jgi:hypothetical protein